MRKNNIWWLLASALSVFVLLMASSCTKDFKDDLDGIWAPIKTDKKDNELLFTSEGGTLTISTTNYPGWWIGDGYELSWSDSEGWQYQNLVLTPEGDVSTLDGGWYSAKIGSGRDSRTMTVTVQPNTSGASRTAYIDMAAGDAFTTVKVKQE